MKGIRFLWVMAVATACAHGTIAGTDIEDTAENRALIALLEEYHNAMEGRDATALLRLVSTNYYEDYGNRFSDDDNDYEQLADQLRGDFEITKAIQLDVRVDDMKVEEATAYAELFYEIRSLIEYPSGEKWETHSDRTRIRFAKEGDAWRIISGL